MKTSTKATAATPAKKATAKKTSTVIADAFKKHPTADKMFETSDGYAFLQEGDANLHAKSLKDKNVETHKRSSAESDEEPTDAQGMTETAGAAATAAAEKQEADLKGSDLGKQSQEPNGEENQ